MTANTVPDTAALRAANPNDRSASASSWTTAIR